MIQVQVVHLYYIDSMWGVYQGDPLSVVIFNTVMRTLADALKADQHVGYTFTQSHRSLNILMIPASLQVVQPVVNNCW